MTMRTTPSPGASVPALALAGLRTWGARDVVVAVLAGRLLHRRVDHAITDYCAQRRRVEGKAADEPLEWGPAARTAQA